MSPYQSDHHHLHHHCEPLRKSVTYNEPLLLSPLDCPREVEAVQRIVHYQEEGGTQIHTRFVLQDLSATTTSTSTTSTHALAYAIEATSTSHVKKNVKIYLATPVMHRGTSLSLIACGPPVLIKAVLRPGNNNGVEMVDDPWSEIGAMQTLQQQNNHHHHHPNVITLLDCMQDLSYIYLVLPYLEGGDLFSLVEASGAKGLPEHEAASYFRQMCEGLLYMKQTSGIAHHDVSLENAMLTTNDKDVLQIIDMGMCLRVGESGRGQGPVYLSPQRCRGKQSYLSPECVREEPLDPFAADVWSLGICLYAMLTGRLLYTSPRDPAFHMIARGGIRNVINSYEKYGAVLSAPAKNLICRMLHADAAKRPTLEEITQHAFLSQ